MPLCWRAQVLLILSIVDYDPPMYGNYEYPGWALGVGWLITLWPLNVIPAYMIYYLIQKGSGQVLLHYCNLLCRSCTL